jgi:hypothetical protein
MKKINLKIHAKRCKICDKILRIQNKSGLCAFHWVQKYNKEKRSKKAELSQKFWIWTMLIIWFILGFTFGIVFKVYLAPLMSLSNNINLTQDCANLSLTDTSTCLQQEVSTFFYYNITNRYAPFNINRLKAEGGVCWQYADYYEQRLKEIGEFYSTYVIIPTGDKVIGTHEFLVMSSDEGYCVLDQLYRDCFMFEKPKDKNVTNEKE